MGVGGGGEEEKNNNNFYKQNQYNVKIPLKDSALNNLTAQFSNPISQIPV